MLQPMWLHVLTHVALRAGMHSSISAHIAADHLLNASTGAWGRNLALFEQRLGNPDVRERVENLYFTYLFTLRALQKAGPLLDQLEFDTGMSAEDQRTKELVHQLVRDFHPPEFQGGICIDHIGVQHCWQLIQ